MSDSGSKLGFFTAASGGGTEALALDSSGNFYIGTTTMDIQPNSTTSPYTATTTIATGLNVGNGLVFEGWTGNTSISQLNIGALNFDTDAGLISWVNLPLDDALAGTAEGFTASIATTSILTVFGYANGDGSVSSTGVIIGASTTPYAKLQVNADDVLAGKYAFIVANSASTTLFTVADNGFVGIGTSSPFATLSVSGNVFVNGNATTTNLFATTASTTNFSGAGLTTCEGGNVLTYNGTGRFGCAADVSGCSLGYSAWGGSVLSTYGTTTIASTTPAWFQGGLFASSTASIPTLAVTQSGTGPIATFNTASLEAMRITSTGLLGIGTSTPFWALTVASSTGPQLALTDGNAANNAWTFRVASSTFYLATSTALSTSTTAALTFNSLSGAATFGATGTTTFTGGITGTYLNLSGATNASTLLYASTTQLSATSLCLTGDATPCRTTWPTTGSTWPFTPSTYNGVANQSTTTPLWLKDTMVLASTTFFTQASTTMFTNTGDTWLTSPTASSLLALDNLGKVIATTSIGTNLLTGILGVGTGGTGASTFGQGWIYSTGGTTALAASTSPTVNYVVATSTTLASIFPFASSTALTISGNTYLTSGSLNHALLSTDANGKIVATTSVGVNYLTGTLGVANGGTGAATLTGLLQGNGTNAVTGIAGTAGQFPYYNGASTLLATSTLFLSTESNVGIGTTSPMALLSTYETQVNKAANYSSSYHGFLSNTGSAQDFIHSAIEAFAQHTGGAALTTMIGVKSHVQDDWGGITNARVFNASIKENLNFQTITNAVGFYAQDFTKVANSTMTNSYGVYVEPQTGATNNYGAYFGSNVGIGTTTPNYALTVGNATKPQLELSDLSGGNSWTLRNIGSTFYLATSTATATSTVAALTINPNGAATFGSPATTTFTGGVQSTYLNITGTAATSTFALGNIAGTLAVNQGGTGATTLTGLLQGNGTGAITGITGTAGQFPYYNGVSTLL